MYFGESIVFNEILKATHCTDDDDEAQVLPTFFKEVDGKFSNWNELIFQLNSNLKWLQLAMKLPKFVTLEKADRAD